jgi:hypothetical protein
MFDLYRHHLLLTVLKTQMWKCTIIGFIVNPNFHQILVEKTP